MIRRTDVRPAQGRIRHRVETLAPLALSFTVTMIIGVIGLLRT